MLEVRRERINVEAGERAAADLALEMELFGNSDEEPDAEVGSPGGSDAEQHGERGGSGPPDPEPGTQLQTRRPPCHKGSTLMSFSSTVFSTGEL